MSEISRKLRIHGRVQGVFFRASAAERASSLGLRGWVRNRLDGTVEILLQGGESAVQRMIEWCRQGPPASRVDRVDVEESELQAPAGFEKRPTH